MARSKTVTDLKKAFVSVEGLGSSIDGTLSVSIYRAETSKDVRALIKEIKKDPSKVNEVCHWSGTTPLDAAMYLLAKDMSCFPDSLKPQTRVFRKACADLVIALIQRVERVMVLDFPDEYKKGFWFSLKHYDGPHKNAIIEALEKKLSDIQQKASQLTFET